jgi:hypothetical protein
MLLISASSTGSGWPWTPTSEVIPGTLRTHIRSVRGNRAKQ